MGWIGPPPSMQLLTALSSRCHVPQRSCTNVALCACDARLGTAGQRTRWPASPSLLSSLAPLCTPCLPASSPVPVCQAPLLCVSPTVVSLSLMSFTALIHCTDTVRVLRAHVHVALILCVYTCMSARASGTVKTRHNSI